MSYPVDPNLEKITKLVEYVCERDCSRKESVLKIIEDIPEPEAVRELRQGPFQSEDEAVKAIIEAGKAISEMNFVTAVFGNLSVRLNDIIYITAAGSKLSDLSGSIVRCTFDGKPLKGPAPSSELPAHLRILNETSSSVVLHAHPFFTVAYSMIKGLNNTVFGVPVVGGDIGGGETGLVHTVPPVLKDFNITVVHGHGVFAVDSFDFNSPLTSVFKLEKLCRNKFVAEYLS